MLVTLLVLKRTRWLNAVVFPRPKNILVMSVTFAVSKGTGWLKASAPLNIWFIVVTLAVLKETGWLKAAAPENSINIEATPSVLKETG